MRDKVGYLAIAWRLIGMLAWIVSMILAAPLCAQDDATGYTLRAYANLLQIPTLVLNDGHLPASPIRQERFKVGVGVGRSFRPRYVRLEGEDPISLTVLVDVSGSQNRILPLLPGAIAGLVPEALHAQDRLNLFVVDCGLAQHNGLFSWNATEIERMVDGTLKTPVVHRTKGSRSNCSGSLHLYDAIGSVLRKMSDLPGRRVLLVVSDGFDGGSKIEFEKVRALAGQSAISVFGFNGGDDEYLISPVSRQLPFLCDASGGLFWRAPPKQLGDKLNELMKMLRGRYIVEFQRPRNMVKGPQNIRVEISGFTGLIHPSGTSAPIAGPNSPDAPVEGPRDPAPAPPP